MKMPFDEMHRADQQVREHYRVYDEWLKRQPVESMQSRRSEAEVIFRRVGITFAVYGAKDQDLSLIHISGCRSWPGRWGCLRRRRDHRRARRPGPGR